MLKSGMIRRLWYAMFGDAAKEMPLHSVAVLPAPHGWGQRSVAGSRAKRQAGGESEGGGGRAGGLFFRVLVGNRYLAFYGLFERDERLGGDNAVDVLQLVVEQFHQLFVVARIELHEHGV